VEEFLAALPKRIGIKASAEVRESFHPRRLLSLTEREASICIQKAVKIEIVKDIAGIQTSCEIKTKIRTKIKIKIKIRIKNRGQLEK
jgi:hypothetical protein